MSMKHGFLYMDKDFERRNDRPDMGNLPKECCMTCENWVQCEGGKNGTEKREYGLCTEACTDEWDAFSWADDLCGSYVKGAESV